MGTVGIYCTATNHIASNRTPLNSSCLYILITTIGRMYDIKRNLLTYVKSLQQQETETTINHIKSQPWRAYKDKRLGWAFAGNLSMWEWKRKANQYQHGLHGLLPWLDEINRVSCRSNSTGMQSELRSAAVVGASFATSSTHLHHSGILSAFIRLEAAAGPIKWFLFGRLVHSFCV